MKIVYAFAVGLTLAGTLSTAPAMAQNARSFVSSHGSDSAACTLPAPCRTFQHAHDSTNAGGEIDVLDPAGYGSIIITKAISIINDGVGTAGILGGATINAGATDAIILRGLIIEGGIDFTAGASLSVSDSVIRHGSNIDNDGIIVRPSAGTSDLSVSNTLVANNSGTGINVHPTGSANVTAEFNHVEVSKNGGDGILVQADFSTGTVNAAVADSFVSHNGSAGFGATAGKGSSTLSIFHSVAANNGAGLETALGSSTIRIAQSMFTNNTNAGWFLDQPGSFSSIVTFGDNYFAGNGPNQGSLTPASRQ